jgi:hypothetical protein
VPGISPEIQLLPHCIGFGELKKEKRAHKKLEFSLLKWQIDEIN